MIKRLQFLEKVQSTCLEVHGPYIALAEQIRQDVEEYFAEGAPDTDDPIEAILQRAKEREIESHIVTALSEIPAVERITLFERYFVKVELRKVLVNEYKTILEEKRRLSSSICGKLQSTTNTPSPTSKLRKRVASDGRVRSHVFVRVTGSS
jgi:hypothetical protein